MFFPLVDSDHITEVVGNKARVTLLSITGCKPLFLSPKPDSDNLTVPVFFLLRKERSGYAQKGRWIVLQDLL